MKISDYNKYGSVSCYVFCEDVFTDNLPKLNKANIAYAVSIYESCDEEGFYPCSCVYFNGPDLSSKYFVFGCFEKSVKFNPLTEEFRVVPPNEYYDKSRLVDYEFYIKVATATLEEVKELIAQGANPSAEIFIKSYEYYSIHRAALNKDINVFKYLVSLGVNPNQFDFWFCQPLSYAVQKNSLEMVKYLVELGNDPENTYDDGGSVLSDAALNPDIKVIEYLISCGAKIECTAIDMTELGYALAYGTVERMKFFMDLGADLALAMENKCYYAPLENIRFALESGYDPNSRGDFWSEEKIIDHLTPKRKALFMKYGGVVESQDADIYGTEISD